MRPVFWTIHSRNALLCAILTLDGRAVFASFASVSLMLSSGRFLCGMNKRKINKLQLSCLGHYKNNEYNLETA